MRSLFQTIAAPIQARMELHDKIMTAFDYVNRARIVTLIDFKDCFTQGDKAITDPKDRRFSLHEQRSAYGSLGQIFEDFRSSITEDLAANGAAKIIGQFHLPSGLANTHTRDVMKKYGHERDAHLVSYYLGDMLDMTDESIALKSVINRAVVFGNGQHVLDIVKRLQALPDYSHHFPNRTPPPDNGNTKRKTEKSPGWSPLGAPRPMGF